MVEILTFPAMSGARVSKTVSWSRTWASQHFPLIDSAMDLGQANDGEFRMRCSLIAETEGRSVLAKMAVQLDRLAPHIAGIVKSLSLTARRIRSHLAEGVTP